MPPHEHLLYLLLHAYKHFVRSGIGLRQFCDIGLWARAYHGEIDWQRLPEQCESVHAATFAAVAFRIARDYLGIEFDLPAPWSEAVDVEPLLHATLCGGVYGSNDLTRLHSSTVTLNAVKASRTGGEERRLADGVPQARVSGTALPVPHQGTGNQEPGGRDISLPPEVHRSMPTARCFFACCTAFSALRRRLKSSKSRVFS